MIPLIAELLAAKRWTMMARRQASSDDVTITGNSRIRLAMVWGIITIFFSVASVGGTYAVKTVWYVAKVMSHMPQGSSLTVHPLGGCRLADSPAEGVTSARPEDFGQVFGYRNLFVADGAIVPKALGLNPSRTIGALAERVAKIIVSESR